MIMDEHFRTRKTAKAANKMYTSFWKYHGTAKSKRGFVAWRTNSRGHYAAIKKGLRYPWLTAVKIDKPKKKRKKKKRKR